MIGPTTLQMFAHDRRQLHGVLLRRHKAVCSNLSRTFQQAVHVVVVIRMVIGEGEDICGLIALRSEHLREVLRPRDAAKGKWLSGQGYLAPLSQAETATDHPNCRRPLRSAQPCDDAAKRVRLLFAQDNDVRIRQRCQRLPQISCRKQRVLNVCLRQQNDVDIARQTPVLESVIEQMHHELL